MNIETEKLEEYLGMAIHFVYYHQNRLNDNKIFEDNYCEHLKKIGDKSYWKEMHYCLKYALTQKEYCIPLIKSPMKDKFSKTEIMTFFEKFYDYLTECFEIA